MEPISKGATRDPIKLILDKIVRAIPTGVFEFEPTKLYMVGTILDIPSPTSINPNELIRTFKIMDSKTPPNNATIKKPANIRSPDN